MRSWIIQGLLLTSALGLVAQPQGPGTTTFSITTVYVTETTNRTVDVETFLTRITARLNSGSPVYDQAFPAALADSTVQAAIAQARTALNAAGAPAAVTITGPAQTASSRTLSNTSVQTVDGTPVNGIPVVTNTVGPATIFVGDNASVSFFVASGTLNSDVKTTVTTPRTVTTTNTYQTSQTYLLAGTTNANPPAVPIPPSLLLGLTGMAGAGLYELRRRLGR